MFLQFPKCFQQCSNPEKSLILFKVRLIWSFVDRTSGEHQVIRQSVREEPEHEPKHE